MVSEAKEPGGASGNRSDDPRGVPEGTPQEAGASTPARRPRIVRCGHPGYPDSLLEDREPMASLLEAVRDIRRRPLRSSLTAGGIAIGVATLVLLGALAEKLGR